MTDTSTAQQLASPPPPLPAGPPQPPAGPPQPPRSIFGPRWLGPGPNAPSIVPGAAITVGVIAAAALPWDRPGVGWVINGAALAAALTLAALAAARAGVGSRRSTAGRLVGFGWAVIALALLATGAVRGAGWLFVLCVLATLVCATVAVAGGRSFAAIVVGLVVAPLAILRALPWASRGLSTPTRTVRGSTVRTGLAVGVGALLLLIFGRLFASADAAFARLLDNVLPSINGSDVFRWIFLFILFGLLTLGAAFLALAPPNFEPDPTAGRRSLRRIEWALPVGLLVGLFATFVGVQITVLFGGRDHVLRTAGLTYAQYARSGFWQLLVVTMLTLAVIAVAARVAGRETRADRIWLRALLGALSGLSLVIVASALSRMWAYEQAYGFTQLRVLVSACELWLGVVFLLVLIAGIQLGAARSPRPWLPSAIIAAAAVTLLGLAGLNPDRFIAQRNVDRYHQTGLIDVEYLGELSVDAVPVLNGLPEPHRTCALRYIARDLNRAGSDSWYEWNLARQQARELLVDFSPPIGYDVTVECRKLGLGAPQ